MRAKMHQSCLVQRNRRIYDYLFLPLLILVLPFQKTTGNLGPLHSTANFSVPFWSFVPPPPPNLHIEMALPLLGIVLSFPCLRLEPYYGVSFLYTYALLILSCHRPQIHSLNIILIYSLQGSC